MERTGSIEKPGNVNAVGAILLAGGILTTLVSIGIAIGSFFLWIPWIYGLVAGIYSIVQGSRLLGRDGPPGPNGLPGPGGPFGAGVPTAAGIMLILNILNCDMMSMTLGIVALALLQDSATQAYLNGRVLEGQGQGQGQGQNVGQQRSFDPGVGQQRAPGPSAAQQQSWGQPQQQSWGQPQQQQAPRAFTPPAPDAWGPPPSAEPPAARQDDWASPSWKSDGWGAQPFANPEPQTGAKAPTLVENLQDDRKAVWDDMDDWERRFRESSEQTEAEPAEVGAGAWSRDKKG